MNSLSDITVHFSPSLMGGCLSPLTGPYPIFLITEGVIFFWRKFSVSGVCSAVFCNRVTICDHAQSMNGWCSIAETTMVHRWHKMAASIIFRSTLVASETLICSIHYSNRFSGGESGCGYYYVHTTSNTTRRCVCKYQNTILIQWTGTTSTFVTDKLMHWNNELLYNKNIRNTYYIH